MKKLLVFGCVGLAAALMIAVAGQLGSKPSLDGSEALPEAFLPGIEAAVPVTADLDALSRNTAKERYYALVERLYTDRITDSEVTEIHELCFSHDLPVPELLLGVVEVDDRGYENGLDDGSPDTLANCASATVIPGCPYNDSGTFDGDNDCSVIAASPYNEVFYTFTPEFSGNYQLRVRSQSGGVAAIRVVSGGCCLGAVNVRFSSSTIATDCQRPDSAGNEPSSSVAYTLAQLTAGVQYWIHVGTSSSTNGITAPYQFNLWCVPCPQAEANDGAFHNTCETALALSFPDSILADSAYATGAYGVDWYTFTKTGWDTVRIFVGAREFGHCISGNYAGSTPSITAVDGRFTLYRYNGVCPGDSIGYDDDAGCSLDAKKDFVLGPGTYYVKVWNYGVQDYILYALPIASAPEPIDCATILPCGSPLEVEPNNACADANILPVGACGEFVYGTICRTTPPQTDDIDYWYVPATNPPEQITVRVWDGAGCGIYPPAGIGVRLATSSTGGCIAPTGSTFGSMTFGGCTAWPGGWIAVVRFAGNVGAYALETVCGTPECPNEVVANQHCSGPCVGAVELDYVWYSFPLDVETQYHITDLNVRVNLLHTYDGDVDMFLVTPWGDSLELSTDNGGSGDNFINTVFDDEAATSIVIGVAPFTGSYIPEEALSGADGYNALGTWTLAIYDDAGGDHGYLNCWCLEFEYDYILAVALGSFEAIARDGSVDLRWTTASEVDNDHFEIIRDGAGVGSVAAAGGTTGRAYAWSDGDVSNGTTYRYTLVAVDVNGGRTELATQSVTPSAGSAVVTEYALHQNYPNPFNPATSITFDMVEAGFVSLKVYNVVGQEVAVLVNGTENAGRHVVSFDATGLPSGLYLYRIETNGFVTQKKMLLMK